MAEVLLARVDGIEGFERHVVIKRIRDEHARDARFVQMFLDEARVAASLHHNNIVHVHDIGQEDGEYFFTMEYVHGEDVRKVLMHLAERDALLPIEHCITIALNTAAALHYAHQHRGADRQIIGIVHRDVSPANILIGYDGNVKVVDFGIAKVSEQTTETGLMKGKVAYMSPEQCLGHAVDRRSDIFCLGIVLYELVTVRRLFKEDNDFLTMTAITHGVIPRPSQLRPDLPPALEAIIFKALASDPAQRYQTADEMRAALERFAASARLQTSTTALADFMRAQFGDRPVPWLVDDEDEVEMSIDFDGSGSGIVSVPEAARRGFAEVSGFAMHSPLARARSKVITGAPAAPRAHATTSSSAMAPQTHAQTLPPPWRGPHRRWWIGGAFAALLATVILAVSLAAPDEPRPPVVPVVIDEVAKPAVARVPVAAPTTTPVAVPPDEPIATDEGSAATVAKKPPKPLKKPPLKKPAKGVWDPKALLPPK